MKKNFLLTLVVTLAYCLLFAIPAFAKPDTLNPGETVTGTFIDDATAFEYTMVLPSSGTLELNIHNENTQLFNFSISNDSVSKSEYLDNGDHQYSYDLAAGEYTIKLDAYNSGTFRMSTSFTSANETYANVNNEVSDIKEGAALPFNKTVTGFIALNDSADCFKIELPTSGSFTLPNP